MTEQYIESRKRENIRPLIIPNKEKIYHDLMNIEESISGRVDFYQLGNPFISEATQLIINAIELFEQGYFDCAYYSLRSAIELSTTMVFLADMPEEEKQNIIDAWKNTKDFPMQKKIIETLSKKGLCFADMKDKMSDFFDKAKEIKLKINKYVHKQGFQFFYVAKNHPLNYDKPQDRFINTFVHYLKKSIGIVAVMRLAIDPFPIMLQEEEIFFRCPDFLTEPYSIDFVNEYIGKETIDAYKTTELYQLTYNTIIRKEEPNQAVFNLLNNLFIDSRRIEEIFSQSHLLSIDELICALFVYACDKVVRVYGAGGFPFYFTERQSKRRGVTWSSEIFKTFAEAEEKINQAYDNVFISAFLIDDDYYYIEHNEKLDEDDCSKIIGILAGALFKIKENQATHDNLNNI